MKRILVLTLVLITLALGVFCLVQRRQAAELQARIDSLQAEREEQSAQIAKLETAQKRAGQQRTDLLRQAEELAAQLQAPHHKVAETPAAVSVATDPPPAAIAEPSDKANDTGASGGFGKFFSQVMKDPEAKKLIRSQQRLMLDQIYAPLLKQMGLTPEEGDQFKGLLTDHMAKGVENATSMFDGRASTNRAGMFEQLAGDQKNFDNQLKELLGDTRYAEYKDYEKTVGERMQLNQFKQQTVGSDHPLTDQQTEQLLAMMKQEKQSLPADAALPGGADQDPARALNMFSDEKALARMMETQETLAGRVYERARTVLYPDQLEAFGRFQTNQAQMMRLGLSMTRKFLSPAQAADGAAQNQ